MPELKITTDDCGGCCDPCEVGDTLDLVLSGITLCPCEFGYTFDNFSGLNTAHTITGVVAGTGSLGGVGSIDWHRWDTGACDSSELESGTTTFGIAVTCLDGVFGISVTVTFNTSVSTVTREFFNGTGALDAAIANARVCGDTGPVMAGENGTGTLSLP